MLVWCFVTNVGPSLRIAFLLTQLSSGVPFLTHRFTDKKTKCVICLVSPVVYIKYMAKEILAYGWHCLLNSLFKFLLFTVWFCLFFNWSIVGLQCCVNFRCTARWFRYIYVYIYIYTHTHTHTHTYILFQILFHYRLL